jgi:paraquat-inducible protein B
MHLNEGYAELPAITSSSQEVQKNITDAIREIQNIPFQALFAELLVTVKNIKQLTGSNDTKQAIHDLAKSLVEIKGIMRTFNQHSESIATHAENTLKHSSNAMAKLDQGVEPLLADAHLTLASSRQMLQQFQSSADSIGEVFNKDAQLQRNLNRALIELRRSAKSLRLLADYLERYPEALIKGKRH